MEKINISHFNRSITDTFSSSQISVRFLLFEVLVPFSYFAIDDRSIFSISATCCWLSPAFFLVALKLSAKFIIKSSIKNKMRPVETERTKNVNPVLLPHKNFPYSKTRDTKIEVNIFTEIKMQPLGFGVIFRTGKFVFVWYVCILTYTRY